MLFHLYLLCSRKENFYVIHRQKRFCILYSLKRVHANKAGGRGRGAGRFALFGRLVANTWGTILFVTGTLRDCGLAENIKVYNTQVWQSPKIR